jgi:formylglycine-generating enzyme required for sulfatase activity
MKSFQITVGDTTLTFLPIPKGSFLMGSNQEEIQHAVEEFPHLEAVWFEKEYPQHAVDVPAFYMAETQITNHQWQIFMDTNSISRIPEGFDANQPDCPVWGITFDELAQFCTWLSKESGYAVTIPTEAQWEKAARGTDAREYPWGNAFDKSHCNTKEGGIGRPTSVGSFQNGKSPYGILDLAGNVEEWTSTKYQPYPGGKPIHDRFGDPGDYYVTRGGSFDHEGDLARCARRHGGPYEHSVIGGRVVVSIPTEED